SLSPNLSHTHINNVMTTERASSNTHEAVFVHPIVSDIRHGKLVPLRTKAEVQASTETIDVYIVEIPSKSASTALDLIKRAIPNNDSTTWHHIRRFVKPEYLPQHLLISLAEPHSFQTLHMLICPTATITLEELTALFATSPRLSAPLAPLLRVIPVPKYHPASAIQAAEWSEKYWPIAFKNQNPYGPHPALIARAGVELATDHGADTFIALAHNVGLEVGKEGFGMNIGAVVVERNAFIGTKVVAVAGDARYLGTIQEKDWKKGNNPMAHAVMRAIGMVAEKRVGMSKTSAPSVSLAADAPVSNIADPFVVQPITPVEKHYFELTNNLAPNGYLCLDLEIYLTHEPCTMCAMALSHSRFGRVAFAKEMLKTGGLGSEKESLGYGLFWTDSNWRMLCWRWESADEEGYNTAVHEDTQA
ncbi:cytidine deaminase-like protein, partial [Tothia fuscella]